MNNKYLTLVVVAAVALVIGLFGGYYYAQSNTVNQVMMAKDTMQKEIDDLKMKNDELMQAGDSTSEESMMKETPKPTDAMMKDEASPTDAMQK